jgi:hypothetical protein
MNQAVFQLGYGYSQEVKDILAEKIEIIRDETETQNGHRGIIVLCASKGCRFNNVGFEDIRIHGDTLNLLAIDNLDQDTPWSAKVENVTLRDIDLTLRRVTVTGTERGRWWGPFMDRNDRQDHIIAVAGIDLARAGDEIGEDGVHDFMPCGDGDDMAHGKGAARSQADGAGVGAVIVALGRGHHAFAGGFVHLWVPVEGTADRGGRQPQLGCQFLEIHGRLRPNRFEFGARLDRSSVKVKRLRASMRKRFRAD